MLNSIKKYLLIFSGSLSLVLGIIGIFIPVLPTTPFLLLASFCYLKSSKRLYQWLISHKVFGGYIYCYITYKAVLKSTKIISIALLWSSLALSITFVNYLHIRICLVAVGIGVSIHLFMLKTLKKEDMNRLGDRYKIKI